MRNPDVLVMGWLGMGAAESPTPAAPYQIQTGPVSQEPEPGAPTLPASSSTNGGWPPPAVPRAAAWTTENGTAQYRIQKGDTLAGLAKTYLGSYYRTREWIAANPDRNPDSIPIGDLITPPPDAITNAKQRGFLSWTVSSKTGRANGKRWIVGGAIAGTAIIGGTAAAVHFHHKHT